MSQDRYRFSRQEERVLSLALAGNSDQAIAEELGVGLGTIRTFWKRIRTKAGGGTRSELLATLAKYGAGTNDGEADATLGSIVRRQAAESEARRANRRLEALIQLHEGAVWVVDHRGRGRSGNRDIDLLSALSHDADVLSAHLNGREPFQLVVQVSGRPARLDGRPIVDGGLVEEWIVSLKEGAPKSDGLMSSALRYARTGIGAIDVGARFLLANERLAFLIGREPGDIVGRNMLEMVPYSDKKRLESTIHRADTEGEAQCSVGLLHRDGGQVPALCDFAAVRDNGRVLHRVVTVRRMADASRLIAARK